MWLGRGLAEGQLSLSERKRGGPRMCALPHGARPRAGQTILAIRTQEERTGPRALPRSARPHAGRTIVTVRTLNEQTQAVALPRGSSACGTGERAHPRARWTDEGIVAQRCVSVRRWDRCVCHFCIFSLRMPFTLIRLLILSFRGGNSLITPLDSQHGHWIRGIGHFPFLRSEDDKLEALAI